MHSALMKQTSAPTRQLSSLSCGQTLVLCSIHMQRAPRIRAVSCQAAAQESSLPPSLRKIVGAFQMVPDPMARYKQLLFFATKLAKLPAEHHISANKVEGCVSQVWVVPELREDGRVYWSADSDSQLTKGLAALLVTGLSGCMPQEIINLQPDFFEMLGLKQSLTPGRNNGFLNILKLMQRKTQALIDEGAQQNGHQTGHSCRHGPTPATASTGSPPASSDNSTSVKNAMQQKLQMELDPIKLTIENKSAAHAGHGARMASGDWKAGVGANGETHFNVFIVSEKFTGKSLLQRHQLVNQILADEFRNGLHALQLDTKSPAEAQSD